MATIYIDNNAYESEPGKNLLEACLTLGFDLPYFCWHPALGSIGACRQCAVKVYRNEADRTGRLVMSCMEPVVNDMRLSIEDREAREFRKQVIEWLMTNHPHDCAVCDEGGSCHLQDMTVMTGHNYRRYDFRKRSHRNQYLGPFLNHEMNRCIQCYRCVRFYKDYAGGTDLDVFASRNNVYFGRHEDGVLENEFSGNLAEVCPTGVFTDKTLKEHYTRKWDLTHGPSVCQHCSLGCNTLAGERYGSLRMISNRYNGEVNGYFLCDRGRFGYEFVNSSTRIRQPLINGKSVTAKEALNFTANAVRGRIIGIGSARASIESNFALKNLVGEDNFYLGVSQIDYGLNRLAFEILTHRSAKSLSMKEVEKSDAVLILGEDLTNTAPMMALTVRQSIRQVPLGGLTGANIPSWNDAAAREWIQQERGPLFIGSVSSTKLDDIAFKTFRGSPDDLAKVALAIANSIDADSPAVEGLTHEQLLTAREIASVLTKARNPVVISGTSSKNAAVLMASANVADALHKKNKSTGIVLIFPEANSLGLTIIGGKSLDDGFEFAREQENPSAIVLENDLYRHADEAAVETFFNCCGNVITVDHTAHRTARRSSVVFPAGTFAEADGTLVNNEGRAQRFFQVYEPLNDVCESWRWITRIASEAGSGIADQWSNLGDVTLAASRAIRGLRGIELASPPTSFRVNGQKIPRESHRFSGRTSMLSNINVSEPKPPEDSDSALSYTMEGYRGMPPSSMIPFFWSPGWNSVQSTNKYQEQVGGPLRGGDPGVRVVSSNGRAEAKYFKVVFTTDELLPDQLRVVPFYHIFGSEPLSSIGKAVSGRVPSFYVAMNPDEASQRQLKEGERASIQFNGKDVEAIVRIDTTLAGGLAALPWGISPVPYFEIPSTVRVIKVAETSKVKS